MYLCVWEREEEEKEGGEGGGEMKPHDIGHDYLHLYHVEHVELWTETDKKWTSERNCQKRMLPVNWSRSDSSKITTFTIPQNKTVLNSMEKLKQIPGGKHMHVK